MKTKKVKHIKHKGGNADLIDYTSGGTGGDIPTFVEDIAGTIVWTINSVIGSINVIEDIMGLASNMGTAFGPNVPPEIK